MISNQTHTSNTTELAETKQHKFHVKDPGSALTHFIAMIGAAIAAVPLLHKAAEEADSRHLAALAVFIVSMILLMGPQLNHTLVVMRLYRLENEKHL